MARLSSIFTVVYFLASTAFGWAQSTNSIQLRNGAGSAVLKAASTGGTYTLTFPSTLGGAGQTLISDGAGAFSWGSAGGATSIDGLSDAKSGGAGFTNSLVLGHRPAGPFTEDASNNTGTGYDALLSITTGDQNTAYGFRSLRYLTIGSWNTAIGEMAGWEHSSADGNTFVGMAAGMTVKTGSWNVGIGASVMEQASPGGSYNTAIGYAALKFIGGSDGSAVSNVAVGAYALHISDYGKRNVAVGRDAGENVSSGTDNVLIGYRAGESLWAGTGNVFIGSQVGSDASLQDENDLLMIDNSNTLTPLIQGDFSTDELVINGSLQARQIRRNIRSDATGGTHTVQESDCWIIVDNGGQTYIGLPDPATNVGRELMFKTRQAAGNLVSGEEVPGTGWVAVNNVEQLDGAVTFQILPGAPGSWATLVAIDDGDNGRGGPRWVIMQRSP